MRDSKTESELEVLVTGTSDRRWKIAEPLKHVGDSVSEFQITGKESIIPLYLEVKDFDPDVVICDAVGRAGFAAFCISKLSRVTFAVRIRGDAVAERSGSLIQNLNRCRLRAALKDAVSLLSTLLLLLLSRHQIFVSEYCRDRSELSPMSSSQSVVIPTPIHIDQGTERESNANNMLLSVSNFNFKLKAEGLAECVVEMDEILTQYPEWDFKIAGDGEYIDVIHNSVEDAKSESYEVLGYVDDVQSLYAEADIFIHMSYLDAYPSTVLEASSYALPTLANGEVGMREQIEDGRTGYIVDLDDPDELHDKMSQLLENEKRRTEMGECAKDQVIDRNSKETIGRKCHNYLISIS